ncbi:DUF3795 domain-containing protein [Candidatus Bathyarchaeota archaeon]|nr:DUF3795 domain-containing protein [Candidatus Bathyarchaeota archaeon]
MTENLSEWVISNCGLNCAQCDIYQAGRGNEKLRNEILDWFKKERNEPLKPEQITCMGCRGPPDNHWSSDCKMLLCAKNKGLNYCFQCEDFPCTIVKKFATDDVSHHKRTVENAKEMRKIGLEAWIAQQKRKGQCLFCP